MPTAVNVVEAGECRKKLKNTVLSDEDQILADGDAKLLEEITAGNFDAALKRLDGKQKINVADENGISTVHAAIKSISSQVAGKKMTPDTGVKFLNELVSRGAFVDYTDGYGKKPINVAIEGADNAEPLVDVLLGLVDKAGARVVDLVKQRPQDGHTMLHDAAWVGNTYACGKLLDTGLFADLMETTNKQGQTPLHVAAFRSPKELVKLLTDGGADHHATEKNPRRLSRDTAEVMAVRMGRQDSADYLKSLSVTLNAVKFASKMKKGGADQAAATGKE